VIHPARKTLLIDRKRASINNLYIVEPEWYSLMV
jgi:hypothetical protein